VSCGETRIALPLAELRNAHSALAPLFA